MIDIAHRLRKLRVIRQMTQTQAAIASGVGEKTISSFETSQRIGSIRVAQLRKLLGAYRMSEVDFYSGEVERIYDARREFLSRGGWA